MAVAIALLYLALRGLPILVMYAVHLLPPDTLDTMVANSSFWLTHVYPVTPVGVMAVPPGFLQALAVLPVLLIEALLVFLFSARFLQRRPWTANGVSLRRWLALIAAIIIWSGAVRHQVLAYVQMAIVDYLTAQQNAPSWAEDWPFWLIKAHAILIVLFYATAPLWAWLPAWLFFRTAKRPAQAEMSVTVASAPLRRAGVFASFLLGCLTLHFALTHAVYTGLWPWAAELARLHVAPESLDGWSLPLSLSQIGLATLVSILAAHLYARRFTAARPSRTGFILVPLMSGAAVYLLTCLVLLALAWLVLWLNPGMLEGLLNAASDRPQEGVGSLVAINLGALGLLCLLSVQIARSPRRCGALMAGLLLCAAIPCYVAWVLVGANQGTRGDQPGLAVTGELGDTRWRNMEQWCTGVVETRHGTWLIGRDEESVRTASYVPEGVPDLSQLVTGEVESDSGWGVFGSRPLLTTLALLQSDGSFRMVALLPEVTCLMVSPESETLYLFTGIRRPDAPNSSGLEQTVVFRSIDHGASWEWLESGFMHDVQRLAWNLKPTFGSDRDVWAWGEEPPGEDDRGWAWGRPAPAPSRHAADGTELRPTALFYSADRGESATAIYSPEPLVASKSYLQELVGEPAARFSDSRRQGQEHHVVQVDDRRAYAWVSESTWYHIDDDSEHLRLTTRAELVRPEPGDEWMVTSVDRQPGISIEHLSTSVDGRTYAVLHDNDGEWLALLDPVNGKWVERRRTPSLLPTWLADDGMATRYFWSNGDYQVVSKWGYMALPRLLVPFSAERAEILTDGHFYTRDGGRSWSQLAIPGYLGVMGLSRHGSKLYWTKGNWYANDEPQQWEYDLAR